MSLLELFCAVDDFCVAFESKWQQTLLGQGLRQWRRGAKLCLSERMTIIHFHQSGYRTFKDYYLCHVCTHLQQEFPYLLSYARFVELMPQTLVPLLVYRQHSFGSCTGIAFVDATSLAVWRNQRISQHKVFAGIAARGKTSMGWFYGFKLHLVANDRGDLLACQITPGNADEVVTMLLEELEIRIVVKRLRSLSAFCSRTHPVVEVVPDVRASQIDYLATGGGDREVTWIGR